MEQSRTCPSGATLGSSQCIVPMVFLCSGSGCLWCLKSFVSEAVCGSNSRSYGLVSVNALSVRLQCFMIDLSGLMTSFSSFLRPTLVD